MSTGRRLETTHGTELDELCASGWVLNKSTLEILARLRVKKDREMTLCKMMRGRGFKRVVIGRGQSVTDKWQKSDLYRGYGFQVTDI